jgi:hypothetical protein
VRGNRIAVARAVTGKIGAWFVVALGVRCTPPPPHFFNLCRLYVPVRKGVRTLGMQASFVNA